MSIENYGIAIFWIEVRLSMDLSKPLRLHGYHIDLLYADQ